MKKDQQPKLLCDIKCLKNVVTFFFFFGKCQKFGSVGRRETEKKKGMALRAYSMSPLKNSWPVILDRII